MSPVSRLKAFRLLVCRDHVIVAAAIGIWSGVAALGWWTITAYSYKTLPDAGAAVAEMWPDQSQLPRQAGRAALVVFLHPKCPCSRATLAELERLLTPIVENQLRLPQIFVVAATPMAPDADWTASSLIERSRDLPGAVVLIDQGGLETAAFGAVASGTVMLFDEQGRRTYRGGVTISRGHEGRSGGGDALARLLTSPGHAAPPFPAFGCRLVSTSRCVAPLAATP